MTALTEAMAGKADAVDLSSVFEVLGVICTCPELTLGGATVAYTGEHPFCGPRLATYSCASGAPQGGNAVRNCQEDGTWDGTAPGFCGCPSLSAAGGLTVAYSSEQAVASVATYTCGAGLPQGGDATRTCLADGSWGGSAPQTCGCGPLSAPSGMSIAYSSEQSVASVATYSCDSGATQGGDASRTCQSDGGWDGSAPSRCGCAALPAVDGGTVAYSNDQLVGSVATYSCESGDAPSSGDASRTCGADGAWGGTAAVCRVRVPLLLSFLSPPVPLS